MRLSKKTPRILAFLLCAVMMVTFTAPAITANAIENDQPSPVSFAELEPIVEAAVNKAFADLEAGGGLEKTLTDIIGPIANTLLGSTDAIVALVQPMLTAAVTALLAQYAPQLTADPSQLDALIGQILTSSFITDCVQYLLDNGFVEKTVEYAVQGALTPAGLDEMKQEMLATYATDIFNTKNTQSYGGAVIKLPETIPFISDLLSVKIFSNFTLNDIATGVGMYDSATGYYKFPTKTYLMLGTPSLVHSVLKTAMGSSTQNDGLFSFYDLTCSWKSGLINTVTVNGWNAKFIEAYLDLSIIESSLAGQDFTSLITDAAGRAALDILKGFVFGELNGFFAQYLKINLGLDPAVHDWADIFTVIKDGATAKARQVIYDGKVKLCSEITGLLAQYGIPVKLNPDDDIDVIMNSLLAQLENWWDTTGEDQLKQTIMLALLDLYMEFKEETFRLVQDAFEDWLGVDINPRLDPSSSSWEDLYNALEAGVRAKLRGYMRQIGIAADRIEAYLSIAVPQLMSWLKAELAGAYGDAKAFIEPWIDRISDYFKIRLEGVGEDGIIPDAGSYKVVPPASVNLYNNKLIFDFTVTGQNGGMKFVKSGEFIFRIHHKTLGTADIGAWYLDLGVPQASGHYTLTIKSYLEIDGCRVKIADRDFSYDVVEVSFNANGGTSAPAAQYVFAGKAAAAPAQAPILSGYTFRGWLLNGVAYDFSYPVTGDIELVANWEAAQGPNPPQPSYVTVTFYMNDGTNTVFTTRTIEQYTALSAVAGPSRDGYTFDGWYTAATGGALWNFNSGVSNGMSLYAHWTANQIDAPDPIEEGGEDIDEPDQPPLIDPGEEDDGEEDGGEDQGGDPGEDIDSGGSVPLTGGIPFSVVGLLGFGLIGVSVMIRRKK